MKKTQSTHMKILTAFLLFSLMTGCGTASTEPGLTDDFVIMAYSGPPLEEVTLERYQEIADAGIEYLVPGNGTFNLEQNLKALELAEQVGIGIIPIDMRFLPFALKPDVSIDTAVIKQMARDYKDHPAFAGYFVKDEPSINMYPALKEIADVIYSEDPVNETFSCLFPTYGTLTQFGVEDYRDYIRSFIETVQPGLLSYDSYVLRNEETIYGEWFKNLDIVRDETHKADIPFLVFIQSIGIEEGLRVPGRAEILWQVNTALSYGARGIGWFSYWTPNPGMGLPHVEGASAPVIEHYYNGPIDIDGNRTDMYDYVREANLYLKKAGKGLLGWDNTDVARYENGTMVQGGSSPVVSLNEEEGNVIIGTYRNEEHARIVISNASCDKSTSFALSMAANWELDQVFTSIDADPSGQNGSMLDWTIKAGGSVIIELKKRI
ncbi:MAG: hypothetical protein ABFS10_09395 [Bacteroidota bacterium]